MNKKEHLFIQGKEKDLGGFIISRTLPHIKRKNIGPFVFIDHMGPLQLDETHAMEVRPHPHIGLATVTYLFEGRGLHHDSLGSKQIISPGDLNVMVSGKGIVHSERTPVDDRLAKNKLHGIQIWLALPKADEDCDPSFTHYPQNQLPNLDLAPGIKSKLIIGQFNEIKSPVKTFSRTLFIDIECESDTNCEISFSEKEIGIQVISGQCIVEDQIIEKNNLLIIEDPQNIPFKILKGTRFIVLGGTPHPEPRFIWWNFVSSEKEKIQKAAKAWKDQSMGRVEGDHEFIPLPNDPLP